MPTLARGITVVLLSLASIGATANERRQPSTIARAGASEWRMTWNGVQVPLAPGMEQSDGDPRFYRTDDGIYFELTSPGGGEDAAALHRFIRFSVPVRSAATTKSAFVRIDLSGNYGSVTALGDGRALKPNAVVTLPIIRQSGRSEVGIEVHDVAGKTWGWIGTPTTR